MNEEYELVRPTKLIVSLSQIGKNYQEIAKHCKTKVMAVLKANAYGHGIVQVGQYLEKQGADYFGVAILEEALLLRESGCTTSILVFGGILVDQVAELIVNDITITASSISKLQMVEKIAKEQQKKAKVHLKIDTGMGRIGVRPSSTKALFEEVLRCEWIEVEGIYSHFANADALDLAYTKQQWQRFQDVLALAEEMDIQFSIRHICNSGGILQLPEGYLDMVRAGILLYGVYPSHLLEKTIAVKPALTWVTKVVYFKVVEPEKPISYGSHWEAKKQSRIVTLPIGYGDGYHRVMSCKAGVLIRGKRYPVVGNICMDQMMVNISWDTAYNGDEVVLLGKQGKEEIAIEELAQWALTIPYEILTSINSRVPRLYL